MIACSALLQRYNTTILVVRVGGVACFDGVVETLNGLQLLVECLSLLRPWIITIITLRLTFFFPQIPIYNDRKAQKPRT